MAGSATGWGVATNMEMMMPSLSGSSSMSSGVISEFRRALVWADGGVGGVAAAAACPLIVSRYTPRMTSIIHLCTVYCCFFVCSRRRRSEHNGRGCSQNHAGKERPAPLIQLVVVFELFRVRSGHK